MNEKKPDNVALNPHSLPYGSNLSAPVIKPNNLGGWKLGAVHNANKHYKERFDEIKAQCEALATEMKWNELIFSSQIKFKPVIGKTYFLYLSSRKEYFMSLFSPSECSWGDEGFQGAFKLNYDNRWEQVK